MVNSSPVYKKLADKWIAKHKELQSNLWAKHGDVINDFVNNTRNFAIGSVSAVMLLSSPVSALLAPPQSLAVIEHQLPVEKSVFLISDLNKTVPGEMRPLTEDE